MEQQTTNFVSRLLRSKIFFAVVLVLFLLSTVVLINEIGRRYKFNQEMRQIQTEISKLANENRDLSNLIDYLNTPEYVESEARTKLLLSKQGESLIVMNSDSSSTSTSSTESLNQQKWLNYFIK